MRLRRFLILAAAALWLSIATAVSAQDLTIAAASDLQGVLPQIIAAFEKETGRTVRTTFGSSGNFFAQIQNGAPFDLYFSADIDYPRLLDQAGLVEPQSLYEYAVGRVVLWTSKGSGVDLRRGLQVLVEPNVRHVAIANPEHAPYGRAAVAALKSAGIYEKVQPKLVMGENISQAAQFVRSGNAEVGIVALSIALVPAMVEAGSYVDIDRSTYPPIRQGAAILKTARNKAVARDFLRFLQQPANAALMQRFGFETPRP